MTSSSLPRVPAERRRAMLAAVPEPRAHAELLEEFRFLAGPEVGAREFPLVPASDALRVVCWNAERGRYLESALALLDDAKPDVLLLSELDCGMARSGQRHTARELAFGLDCGYVYGVEFIELGLGDERERARHAGEENDIGYHGGAILSRQAIARPAVVRLETSGRWFDGSLGERRVGGRIAVVGTVALAGTEVAFASVHLESHSDPAGRCGEFERLLDFLDDYCESRPVLIGGDVNTSSLSVAHLQDRERLRTALADDPERLMNPVAHEPLFALAERRGYDWRACNRLELSTHRTKTGRGRLRLDWFFARDLTTTAPEIIAAVDSETGDPLSDHEALALTVAPRTP